MLLESFGVFWHTLASCGKLWQLLVDWQLTDFFAELHAHNQYAGGLCTTVLSQITLCEFVSIWHCFIHPWQSLAPFGNFGHLLDDNSFSAHRQLS